MAATKATQKALVADDEVQIGTLLKEALAAQGFDADVVVDGELATRKLSAGRYSLIVSDVLMPHKTGVELVQELRLREDRTPFVLMSSHLSEEILVSCSAVEHLAFLQKPFSLTDLRRAIDRASSSVHC